MHVLKVGAAERDVSSSCRPACALSLPAITAALLVFGVAVCLGETPAPGPPAALPPSMAEKTYKPPSDGKTHEDNNLPQDQWQRAYREGLRQGYEAGRLFPQQLDQAYRQGFHEGYEAWRTQDDIYNRTQRLLRNRDEALKAGLQAFAEGSYDQAADQFLLAARMDNGDPASRLHAAQALFALQQYAEAVPLLRRAFELQPNLIYFKFDLRRDYDSPEDFVAQLEDLKAVVAENPDWADGYLLLGYELLHSGQRSSAYKAFTKAAELDPVDTLSRRFLTVSMPMPAKRAAKPAPAAPAPKAQPVVPAPKTQPAASPEP